jgi:hypothetical protein
MRAPRSTRISSDNDSFRWNVYLLGHPCQAGTQTPSCIGSVFQRRFGTSIQVRCQGVNLGTRTCGNPRVILDKITTELISKGPSAAGHRPTFPTGWVHEGVKARAA